LTGNTVLLFYQDEFVKDLPCRARNGTDLLQIYLNWDFTHTVGGLPAATLVRDAAWNLCPVGNALHGTECYFETDQTFPTVAGSDLMDFEDLPAGSWQVVITRDYFRKVHGAVRNKASLLEQANNYTKIDAAWRIAAAGLEYEDNLLQVLLLGMFV
jgi:hypothetical protein